MKKLLTYACVASFVAIGTTGCGDPPKVNSKTDKKVETTTKADGTKETKTTEETKKETTKTDKP